MPLGTDNNIPVLGGRNFTIVIPNKYMIATYINPCYCSAMNALLGYTVWELAREMGRLME